MLMEPLNDPSPPAVRCVLSLDAGLCARQRTSSGQRHSPSHSNITIGSEVHDDGTGVSAEMGGRQRQWPKCVVQSNSSLIIA